MSLNNFFYIITRDGQIFEIFYTPERIAGAIKTMRDKDIFTIKDFGAVINGADIVKILDENQYENYLSTIKVKEYIRNGYWRDGKEHGIIRKEPWRELEDKKMIGTPTISSYENNKVSPEEEERVKEKIRFLYEESKKLAQGLSVNK